MQSHEPAEGVLGARCGVDRASELAWRLLSTCTGAVVQMAEAIRTIRGLIMGETWNSNVLAVRSDPPLRRRYRLLQSWYREHVLGAGYGLHRQRPVGSLLVESEVADDPALNFLGDRTVLDYVNQRAPQVVAEGGTLDEHRLRHNMLSSMPMAFLVAGQLRAAPDRTVILNRMFDLDEVDCVGADAEWVPDTPREQLLGDRTALDVVAYLGSVPNDGRILGIETKYTEPLSQVEYYTPRLVEVTESCGWFRAGAAQVLRGSATNQLWRNALLTRLAGGSQSYLGVVGLNDDETLWESVRLLKEQMTEPDRVIARTWENVVAATRDTSLESFGALFEERYLDTTPLDSPASRQPVRRRSTLGTASQRAWDLAKRQPRRSQSQVEGDDDWHRLVPAGWRALSDPTRTVGIAQSRPTELRDACAYWTPVVQLILWSLAWPSPALGLRRWDREGRPLEDPRLSLIEAVWGRNLDALEHHLWTWSDHFGSRISDELGLPVTTAGAPPSDTPGISNASSVGANPATGGSDPLHLSLHVLTPLEQPRAASVLEPTGGEHTDAPRAVLRVAEYEGWYRELTSQMAAFPTKEPWRVDVIVGTIGYLGTFTRSAISQRCFSGDPKWHALGCP